MILNKQKKLQNSVKHMISIGWMRMIKRHSSHLPPPCGLNLRWSSRAGALARFVMVLDGWPFGPLSLRGPSSFPPCLGGTFLARSAPWLFPTPTLCVSISLLLALVAGRLFCLSPPVFRFSLDCWEACWAPPFNVDTWRWVLEIFPCGFVIYSF